MIVFYPVVWSTCFPRNIIISCFVPAMSLQRQVRINYRLPSAFIVTQYLLLVRYGARGGELSGSVCLCALASVCETNQRIRKQGFGDWKGWLHAILRVDGREGFVLFSREVRPRASRIAEGHWNTFGSCQTAWNLSTLVWKPPISHARHNFRALLTFNA